MLDQSADAAAICLISAVLVEKVLEQHATLPCHYHHLCHTHSLLKSHHHLAVNKHIHNIRHAGCFCPRLVVHESRSHTPSKARQCSNVAETECALWIGSSPNNACARGSAATAKRRRCCSPRKSNSASMCSCEGLRSPWSLSFNFQARLLPDEGYQQASLIGPATY